MPAIKITSAASIGLAIFLTACGSSSPVDQQAATKPRPVITDTGPASGTRTLPDPLCVDDYLGTTGLLASLPIDHGSLGPDAIEGGAAAEPSIAVTLPARVHLRGTRESYTAKHYVAVREGRLFVKANEEVTGTQEMWREMLVPRCLQGKVSEVSADGTVVLALNQARDIYSWDSANYGPGASGWTRRWGAPFWTDMGEAIPADVRDWATSHTSGSSDDVNYIDSAGREQAIYGILTVYALRGDGLRITYMDPWLPSDESREVCGPERGTVPMAGLTGSGSTVMVVGRDGRIYTRLYEFDVSGGNAVFFDYSWQDQENVAAPLLQLPAPDWIAHSTIPGRFTNRLSLRKLPPDTRHRIMRVEGWDSSGRTGYWQKDIAERKWKFVRTDEAIRGTEMPLQDTARYLPEDSRYSGNIDGYAAEVLDFNPYCSPATLRLQIEGKPLDLVLHSTDGLRQERRARGLDGNPHVYRSAVEVPKAIWNKLDTQPAAVQTFIRAHFGSKRFLTGPLSATPGKLQIAQPCWTLRRDSDVLDLPVPFPDAGIIAAEVLAAQEEGRLPAVCLP
ncbi:hypothetical protein [Stenotrophobium rhamnosiphilum]|uniref:Lipoprotein n=1 Tax=Stenotrophobium rhamnosiphilum TaxID=2029166 RepID=A0A2T5MBB5_9GAMM|nr:hypothetical protein [Stenotrophobium rhamnosiphilum]PTU29039.1 hypothetical protein CJD38_16890 [Stenotrophobium rhamnosiphilum]